MAYDAARGEYLVLKATTPRPSDLQSGTTPILRLGDGPAIGEPVRRQLDRPAVTSDSMTSTTPLVRAHAHGGLLYAILIPGTVNLPIDVYRMP